MRRLCGVGAVGVSRWVIRRHPHAIRVLEGEPPRVLRLLLLLVVLPLPLAPRELQTLWSYNFARQCHF
eukprot:COSAG05_NODE_21186_length_274_cov_0.445714_1_plen_67_part_10